MLAHPELFALTLSHIDCDAFYATVEKRDNPDLLDKPVIVGGGRRGVATTACYIARRFGVRSAMPMFKALKLCPQAVVIRPDMEKYAGVSRQIRTILREATPLVEPISLDEAYLDLAGTEALHKRPPAIVLAGIARRIEAEIGITVSIGLAPNKLLAKLASDMDKPRGFGVIGRGEATAVLAPRPVGVLPGVGPRLAETLIAQGFRTVGDLQRAGARGLAAALGDLGHRLAAIAVGEDRRAVVADHDAKSVSAETTFEADLHRYEALETRLWPLAERVSARLKRADIAGKTVFLTLRTASFRRFTRRVTLAHPTQLADTIFSAAQTLLRREVPEPPPPRPVSYRLIGVGVSELTSGAEADPGDLFDPRGPRQAKVEHAMDAVRARFGPDAILRGRSLRRR